MAQNRGPTLVGISHVKSDPSSDIETDGRNSACLKLRIAKSKMTLKVFLNVVKAVDEGGIVRCVVYFLKEHSAPSYIYR